MVNVTANLSDEITAKSILAGAPKLTELSFGSTVNPAQIPKLSQSLSDPEINLALRAAKLFEERFSLDAGIEFSLRKNIPAGGGLGGGSSNAASILKILSAHHVERLAAKYSDEELFHELCAIGLKLGADVPYAIRGGACIVKGVGQTIIPCSKTFQRIVDGTQVFIALPDTPTGTKEAYQKFGSQNTWLKTETRADSWIEEVENMNTETGVLKSLSGLCENDFEAIISDLNPEVASAIEQVRNLGIGTVNLTGSGSSFAILPFPALDFSHSEQIAIKNAFLSLKINYFDGRIQLYYE